MDRLVGQLSQKDMQQIADDLQYGVAFGFKDDKFICHYRPKEKEVMVLTGNCFEPDNRGKPTGAYITVPVPEYQLSYTTWFSKQEILNLKIFKTKEAAEFYLHVGEVFE